MLTELEAACVAAPIAIVECVGEAIEVRVASPAFHALLAFMRPASGQAREQGEALNLRESALRFDYAAFELAQTALSAGQPEADLIAWQQAEPPPAGPETTFEGQPYRLILRPYPDPERQLLCITAEPYGIDVEGGRRDRSLFGQIVERSPDIIAVIDRELRHVYVNQAILRASGSPPEAYVGRDHFELGMPAEMVDYFQSVYRQVFETGEEGSKEFEFPAPDGVMRTYVSRVVPLPEADGETRVLLSYARDVTERRAAETARLELERKLQETQRLESLGLLAGGIAHDFNNILTSILGMASLARAQAMGGAGDQALRQIENACVKAADLCNQMLAYAGRGQTHKTSIDMASLVRETHDLLRGSVPDKVRVRVEAPEERLPTQVDRPQLQQVLMNLLLNAVECYGERPGEVHVQARRERYDEEAWQGAVVSPEPGARNLVCVAVQDFGPGMDEDTAARVFEPFFTTKFAGRGLGLAATLGIVRSHGGGLKMDTAPKSGTTFTLCLPEAEADAREVPSDPLSSATLTHARVLIVDDEPMVREAAVTMTEALGYEVEGCEDGVSALVCLESEPANFDAVLLDLTMPQMNGFELLRRIRDIHPELPVVLMSGYVESDIRERAGSEPSVRFLQKPFTLDQLDHALAEALRGAER